MLHENQFHSKVKWCEQFYTSMQPATQDQFIASLPSLTTFINYYLIMNKLLHH